MDNWLTIKTLYLSLDYAKAISDMNEEMVAPSKKDEEMERMNIGKMVCKTQIVGGICTDPQYWEDLKKMRDSRELEVILKVIEGQSFTQWYVLKFSTISTKLLQELGQNTKTFATI